MLKITSKKDGFWRCGVRHSKETQTYADDKFTAKELKALKAEPMLVVQEVADEDAGKGKKEKDSK